MGLDAIKRKTVKKLISMLLKKGLSKSSIRLIVAALGVLYREAIEDEIVEHNPTLKLSKFYKQAPIRSEDIDPLNAEEATLLLSEAFERLLFSDYVLILTALHTGMRSGELAGLWWDDIDWHRKVIHVRRASSAGVVTPLKTKNGYREVDCSDELLAALDKLKKSRQELELKKGKNEIPKWVFANRSGNPADMHNFTERVFRPLLKAAKLRPIRLHDTRHSFASLLLAQGEPITYVSDQLGHANPQITLRIYSRWIPHQSQRDAVNKLPSMAGAVV